MIVCLFHAVKEESQGKHAIMHLLEFVNILAFKLFGNKKTIVQDCVYICMNAVEEEPDEKLGKTHSGVFAKDLPWLMYGFGDADKPLKV